MKELKNYEDENFKVFELPVVSPQMRFMVVFKDILNQKKVTFLNQLDDKFIAFQGYNISLGKVDDLDKVIASKKNQLLIEKNTII